MAERVPIASLANEWKNGLPHHVAEIREMWPDLAQMLDGLVQMNSRVITGESPPMVPPITPARPGSGPRSGSATRSGHRGTVPTSDPVSGVQMPIFQEPKEK